MLFRSETVEATWDTWMYYASGKYYQYYLITENSPGEGFGVAVSEDGVHFRDYGKQLDPSPQMTFYLGTGSVWKPLDYTDGYLCNYSEWRMHGKERRQQIFFARSDDLIHWQKCDEKYSLQIDSRYYSTEESKGARWDCINTLRMPNGYYGYWTAKPHGRIGVGFGKSTDGLNWTALPPPVVEDCFDGREIESGSVTLHNGVCYMLVGCYSGCSDVVIMTAPGPEGPFFKQRRSASIFANQERMHGYFARFFDSPEGTLVNFHVLLREENAWQRPYTYLAPLKLVDFDEEGILRLRWWHGNDRLIGSACDEVLSACLVNAVIRPDDELMLELESGDALRLCVNTHGVAELKAGADMLARVERGLDLCGELHVKLLVRDTMLEWYLNDWYMFCYTLPAKVGRIAGCGTISYHQLDFD